MAWDGGLAWRCVHRLCNRKHHPTKGEVCGFGPPIVSDEPCFLMGTFRAAAPRLRQGQDLLMPALEWPTVRDKAHRLVATSQRDRVLALFKSWVCGRWVVVGDDADFICGVINLSPQVVRGHTRWVVARALNSHHTTHATLVCCPLADSCGSTSSGRSTATATSTSSTPTAPSSW